MGTVKSINGLVFIVLGAAIIVQIVRSAGLRFEVLPGTVLGAAMIALGVYRTLGLRQRRR